LTRNLGLALLLLAGIITTATCGGGGGGGGGPTQPPAPQSSVVYTPDASAGSNSIYLGTGSGSAGSTWVMNISAQSVSDLYGVSLLIDFPSNLLSFSDDSESEGSFLDGGGDFDTELVVRERGGSGEITVGLSRLGLVPGADGSGMLLSLRFNARSSGTGTIDIRNGAAVDSLGVVQEDVTFIGGSVRVTLN